MAAPRPIAPPPRKLADEWFGNEPGWGEFVIEVRRLARRNRAHPWPLLAIVLVTTLVGLWQGYVHKPSYEARISLRLTENDVVAGAAPRPVSELRSWVADVALSDGHLIKVIERYRLYPQLRARGLDQALDALRDDLEVEVWRNEFLDNEESGLLGRAARVALSFRQPDPDLAFSVVSDLAAATVDEQRRMRRAQVAYTAMGLEPAIEAARAQLAALRSAPHRIETRALVLAPSVLATASKESDEIDYWEKRVSELDRQQEEAKLRLRAETLNLGLQSDIIDTVQPRRRAYRLRYTTIGALLGLVCGLLLGGVTIKAFDRRIYDPDDLRRLGYAVCGALPSYPGDGVGSMKSRLRMTARVSPGGRGRATGRGIDS